MRSLFISVCDLNCWLEIRSDLLPPPPSTGHGCPAGQRRLLQGRVGEPLQAGVHRHPALPPGPQQLLRRDAVHVQRGEGSPRQASFIFIFFLLDHSFFLLSHFICFSFSLSFMKRPFFELSFPSYSAFTFSRTPFC